MNGALTFPWLGDADRLRRLAAAFGVDASDFSHATAVHGGLRFTLATRTGAVWLRVLEGADPSALEKEHRFLDYLRASHFPAVHPVRASTGKACAPDAELLASLFLAPSGERRAPADLGFEALERLGEELGKLHRLGNQFPEGVAPLDLDAPGRRLRALHQRPERQIANAAASLLARLSLPEVGLLPEGPVHGDVGPHSVRWLADRVAALHGFERLGFAPFIVDLAQAVSAFCLEPALDPSFARALVLGYERERVLSPLELRKLPSLITYAALTRASERLETDPLAAAATALELADRVEAVELRARS